MIRIKKRHTLIGIALIAATVIVSVLINKNIAFAATRTWDGGGADEKWSTCANWSLDTCPTTADIVIFDGTSTKNATIDAGFTTGVTTFTVNAGYTGIITQERSFTVSGNTTLASGTFAGDTSALTFTGTLTVSGGTFTGGNQTVQQTGAFTLSSGTYTASSGTTTFNAGFTHTAGGTFAHNNGSIKFSGIASTIDVTTSEAFYNLELSKNNAVLLTVASGDTLTVNNTLTLTNGGFTTGTVNAKNTISLNTGWDGGGGTLLIDGVNTQTLSLNGGQAALASTVTLNNANFTFNGTGTGTLTLNAVNLQAGTIDATGYNMTFSGAYNQSGGTFTGGSGTVSHSTFTLSNGTYTATSGTTTTTTTWTHSGGTYNHGNGTFSSSGGTSTITIVDQDTFYNATFSVTNTNTKTISGGTLIVANTFNFNNTGGGALTATLQLQGDITGTGSTFPGTRTISITGTGEQTWSIPSGFGGTFTINKNGGSVNQTTAITTGTWTFTAGTWNANNSGFTPNSTYTHNGGTMNFGGSTVTLGNFTLSAGTVNATTATMTVNGNWTHTAGGTFTHNNGSVNISTGTTVIDTTSTETFYNLTISPSSTRTITIANNDSCIVLGTLTLSGSNGTIAQTTKPAEGSFQLYGDLTLGGSFANATTTFGFYGSATQYITESAVKAIGNVTINKTGGSVVLNSTLDDGNTMTVTVENGILDLNGNTISMNASSSKLIINAGGTLKLQGGETITANTGYPQFDTGSTVYYNGTAGPYTLKNYATYKNVVIDGASSSTTFSLPGTLSLAENLTVTRGTLSLGGSGLTVLGTFSNNDTVKMQGNETISLTQDIDSGTWTISGDGDTISDTFTLKDFGATDYYNLVVATTDATDIIQSAGAKTVAGTLTVSSGSYDANGQTTTTTGLTTLSGGTYTGGSATQTFNAGLTLSGGTYTGSSGAADVNGNLLLSSGTFTAPTSTTLSGNFTNTGATFAHNNGTVILDADTSHTISGSMSWNSLTLQDTIDNATNTALTIESGSTQTVNGALTLTGLDTSDRVLLLASASPMANTLVFEGTSSFSGGYLYVADNSVTDNSSGITTPLNPANSLDGGNTTNWFPVTPPGITVSSVSGNTSETGTTATFTVVLNAQPTNNVSIGISSNDTGEGTVSPSSLTFTSANWATPQTITITGVDDYLDDGDISYSVITDPASSLDAGYNGLDASDISLTNTDNDTTGFTVSQSEGTTLVTEGGATDSLAVQLSVQPASDVVVDISSNNAFAAAPSVAQLTFTTMNWSTPQNITITAPEDDNATSESVTITVAINALASDNAFDALAANTTSVSVADNDTPGITVSSASGNTSETGTTATVTLVLNTQPSDDVSIGISSNDIGEGTVSPSSLTFTSANWATPQTITITGVDDYLDDGDISYSVITDPASSLDAGYNGLNASEASLSNLDNDVPDVNITESLGNTAMTEGGSDSIAVVLATQPTQDVVLDVASSNALAATVSSPQITFTTLTWNIPQTITITAVEDANDISETPTVTITVHDNSSDATYVSVLDKTVNVSITDNDIVRTITVSQISATTTEAGGTAAFSVVLDAIPSGNVQIDSLTDDSTEGVVTSGSSLTFTTLTWNIPQIVTVTGQDDAGDDGDISYSVVVTTNTQNTEDGGYAAVNPNDVAFTNTDDDVAGITLTQSSGTTAVTEGGTNDAYILTLTSQPSASVVITFVPDSELSTNPSSLTFTTQNWNTPQVVVVAAQDDAIEENTETHIISHIVTSADSSYSNLVLNDVSVSVTDNDTTSTPSENAGGNGGGGGGGGGSNGSSSSATNSLTLTYPKANSTLSTQSKITLYWNWTGTIPAINVYISYDNGATWTLLRYAETNTGSTTIGPITTEGSAVIKVDGTNYMNVLTTTLLQPINFSQEVTPTTETPEETSTSATTDTAESVAELVAKIPQSLSVHDLIKAKDDGDPLTTYDSTIYYIGADGRRHAFPNQEVFFGWYCDFSLVKTVEGAEIEALPLGRNVTYRPGYHLVKFATDPRVFAVERNGELRWVLNETTAQGLYGENWNKKIDTISDAFYKNYVFGDLIADPTWDVQSVYETSAVPSDTMNIPGYTPSNIIMSCEENTGLLTLTKILNLLRM